MESIGYKPENPAYMLNVDRDIEKPTDLKRLVQRKSLAPWPNCLPCQRTSFLRDLKSAIE